MIFEFSTWVLNTHRYELSHYGSPIKIRRKVFKVLSYLLSHRDRNVNRRELLEAVWSKQYVTEESVTSCIKEARQILGDTGRKKRFIQTVHGFGYRFIHPVTVREAPEAEPQPPTLNVKISRHRSSAPKKETPQALQLSTSAGAPAAGGEGDPDDSDGAVVENVTCRVAQDRTTWLLSGSCDSAGHPPAGLAPILDAIRHLNGGGDPIRLNLQWE